ncbi:aminoacyl-tRNA deacylase [Paeniglutamicibacter sp. NPDC091659]|uniref:aminoacyl-tRNA deacylase n=1 Tax=Paeniglutamicibacter sp. NPDC091659 TaxID=3364389 RepID=UPI0038284295
MTDQLPADGLERMQRDARNRGLNVDVVTRPPAGSLVEAAGLMGLAVHEIVKSLVVKHKDGSFFFALIPGDRTISWPKLRALLGVNKLSLPRPEVAFAATGYERGTITPLGATTPWPVYIDSSVVAGRICLGAGAHGHSAFVDSAELISALDATVADISDAEAPG